jgi:hypothetical protein
MSKTTKLSKRVVFFLIKHINILTESMHRSKVQLKILTQSQKANNYFYLCPIIVIVI